jgi:hypothetical protein
MRWLSRPPRPSKEKEGQCAPRGRTQSQNVSGKVLNVTARRDEGVQIGAFNEATKSRGEKKKKFYLSRGSLFVVG